jgi:hypothetical protein
VSYAIKLMSVNISEAYDSADLGNSSNHSNEIHHFYICVSYNMYNVGRALKIVVGKVFLRVALMQELVGPKH